MCGTKMSQNFVVVFAFVGTKVRVGVGADDNGVVADISCSLYMFVEFVMEFVY